MLLVVVQVARRDFLRAKAATTLISASFRGHAARSEYAKARWAATLFAAAFRQARARREYVQTKVAVQVIQTR